jgi:hypothetical protein
MIAVAALSAIATATVYEFALSHGSPANSVTGAVRADSAPPVTTRTALASPSPPAQRHRQASAHRKAQQPVTVGTTTPQPAARIQPQAQAGSSAPAAPPVRTRDPEYAGPASREPWYATGERWPGGFSFPGPRGWGWRF